MRRVLRFFSRALAAAGLVVILLIVAAVILTSTDRFNRLLRNELVSFLNKTYRGTFGIGRVEGSIWSRLELDDVTAGYGGHPVANIGQISLHYSLGSLLSGTLYVELEIEKPQIDLAREPGGTWNLLDSISNRVPSGSSSSMPFALVFDIVEVRDGVVHVFTPGKSAPAYDLTDVGVDGSLARRSSGIEATVQRLVTTISIGNLPKTQLSAALAYQDMRQPAAVDVAAVKLTTSDSTLTASGKVELAQKTMIDLRMAIQKLAAVDIVRLYPASPLIADLSGTLGLKGSVDALRAQIALNGGGAALTGVVDANVVASQPRYSMKLKLGHASIPKLIRAGGVGGSLNASLDGDGSGFNLDAATGHLFVRGQDMTADAYKLGDVELNAGLAHGSVQSTLVVNAPAGRLGLDGVVSIAANPSYRIAVSAETLNIAGVQAGKRPTTPSDINFKATIDGNGLTPASMNTRITGTVSRSRIGLIRIDRAALDLQVARDRAYIRRLDFAGQDATIAINGYAGLSAQASSKVTYRLHVQDAAGLLRLVNHRGGGRLQLAGTLSGLRSALRAEGTLTFDALTIDHYSAHHGEARYDLIAGGPEIVYGDARAQVSDLNTGVRLRSLTTDIHVARGTPRNVSLKVGAEDPAGRRDALAADFTYQPDLIEGRITELMLGLATGEWRLAAPAAFRRDAKAISLGSIKLNNGPQQFVAQGTLAANGRQDFDLMLSQFDLAAIDPLVPGHRKLAGKLSIHALVSGTGAEPNLDVKSSARHVRIDSQPIGDLSTEVSYVQQQATIRGDLDRASDGRLTVAGTIPTTLEWASGFKMKIGNGMDLRVESQKLSLAQLDLFMPNELRDFRAVAAIDLALRGTLSHPEPNGSVRLSGVKGRIVPLGVTISEAQAAIAIDPHQARLTTLEAHAGDGSLTGSGAISLNGYVPGSAGITLRFNNWPAIDTEKYQANLGGNLTADGSLKAPHIHGSLEILNGTIHPDLSFLTASSPLAPDPTITIIPVGEKIALPQPQSGPPPLPSSPEQQTPSTQNAMALDVSLTIHRDTWIRDDYASAELEGQLLIQKKAHAPLHISGTVHTVRGWIQYQERRFTLRTGRLEFTGGGAINPALDFDAQSPITTYIVDIVIGGTARKPTYQLKSTPSLPQADILSLLLFGKTTTALSQGQQAKLQQQAAQMAASYATEKIGRTVASSIGLEELGFQLSGVSTSGGTVGFGHYIGGNTYVSASQNLGGTAAVPGKVSVEYSVLPWLSVTTSTFSDGSREIDLTLTRQY